jgi:predicted ester cyclase
MRFVMTRPLVVPLTILVALATSLTLLGIATTLTSTPISVNPDLASTGAENAVEIVHQFYAAANELLETGDPTALDGAVAVDYRESIARTTSQMGISGYIQFLAELRLACPECRLEILDLVIGNDEAAVRVSTHGRRQGMVQGVSVEGLSLEWSALDVLRLTEGQVVERWSQGEALTVAEPLFTEVAVEVPTGVAIVQVSRRILPSGANLHLVAVPGPTLLVVEVGTLVVHTPGADGLPLDPTTMTIKTMLEADEQLVISPGVRPMIRNDGPLPAIVLAIVLEPGPDQGSRDGPTRWPNHAS